MKNEIKKTATVSKNGKNSVQIVIPELIAQWYDLKPSDKVEWIMHIEDNELKIVEFKPIKEE